MYLFRSLVPPAVTAELVVLTQIGNKTVLGDIKHVIPSNMLAGHHHVHAVPFSKLTYAGVNP